MATEQELKKGEHIIEPGLAISEFVEKLNKLSYKNFPNDEVADLFHKNPLALEYLEPYTFHSDARYTRNLIHKSQDFELILMCWGHGQYSAVHGHEGQKCWMRIEQGELEFSNYHDNNKEDPADLKKIDVKIGKKGFVDGPAYIHGVKNKSGKKAMSLHLYAKPFAECDIYDLDEHQIKKIALGYHSIHGKLVAPEEKR